MTYKLAKTSLNPDPYYGAVSLLLSGDGANNSTDIRDSSRNTKAITVAGDAKISTAQSKFGGSSLYFDGSGDYLSIPNSTNWDLPNDFTIEAWIYLTAYSVSFAGVFGAAILSKYKFGGVDNGWQLRVNGTASSYTTINVYTGKTDLNFATSVSLNTWTHVAVARSGTSIRAFVNGIQAGSTATNSDNFTKSNPQDLWIGGLDDSTYRFWMPGYIDDLRITKGVARYTSNFTPPTQPFTPAAVAPDYDPYFFSNVSLLLKGDGANGSTNIVDSSYPAKTITVNGDAQISTAQSKFGGSSIAFDGTDDVLTIPASADCNFGTGDFTVEAWVYPLAVADSTIVAGRGPTNGTAMIAILNGAISLGRNHIAWDRQTAILAWSAQWYHIAVTRSAGTVFIFRDGTLLHSNSSTLSYNFTDGADLNFAVGGRKLNISSDQIGNFFNGYIDDLRITKGVARYTSNFTPPTQPFPNF